jgi:hypothetical protein
MENIQHKHDPMLESGDEHPCQGEFDDLKTNPLVYKCALRGSTQVAICAGHITDTGLKAHPCDDPLIFLTSD